MKRFIVQGLKSLSLKKLIDYHKKRKKSYKPNSSDLTLDGFKFIYHMEWGHRNWGRGMGVLFMVPLIGFLMSKKMTTVVKKRTLGLMGLLCFQGGMGWYMVKSGLVQPEKIGYKVIFCIS